jgi:hypothetical protein
MGVARQVQPDGHPTGQIGDRHHPFCGGLEHEARGAQPSCLAQDLRRVGDDSDAIASMRNRRASRSASSSAGPRAGFEMGMTQKPQWWGRRSGRD